jgi:serine/threonine protein phosphatase PrpC
MGLLHAFSFLMSPNLGLSRDKLPLAIQTAGPHALRSRLPRHLPILQRTLAVQYLRDDAVGAKGDIHEAEEAGARVVTASRRGVRTLSVADRVVDFESVMNLLSSNCSDHFQFAAVSDIGMRRTNNQDAYILLPAEDEPTWQSRGHVFVVADGMGAHAAGELASKLAVDGVVHHYRKQRQLSPPEAILRALRDTNSEIHQRGQANTEFHNMGTTCSVLLLLPQGALVAHVGDSRVYRVRRGRVEQLTFDHSLLWEMRAAGSLTDGEGKFNVPRNVITRSLGPQATVQVDLEGPLDVQQGDVFLLCSDGLTGKVEDAEIGEILSLLPPADAAQLLVDLANLRGGPDNITALVVRAESPDVQTRAWRGEPLVVGSDLRPPRRVPETVWIIVLVAALLAAGLATLQLYPYAIAAASIAAVGGIVALLRTMDTRDGVALTSGRRLGHAPYVKVDRDGSAHQFELLEESIRNSLGQGVAPDRGERDRAEVCLDEAIAKAHAGALTEAMPLLAVAARLAAQRSAAESESHY